MMTISSWDGALSTEASNEFLSELALRHLGEVGFLPEREYIADCITRRDFHSLCDYDLDVSGLQPLPAYHLGQALAFFRKRVDLDLGIDREAVAYRKFIASENSCALTNKIFNLMSRSEIQLRPSVEAVLHSAQRKIASVLGDVPSLAEFKLRFGPGATTQIQKRAACAKTKLTASPACSEDLLPILDAVLDEMPAYLQVHRPEFVWDGETLAAGTNLLHCEVHDGKLGFVPKSAKTDRAIVVEPWLNSIVQLGIGDYIAKRLRRVGIDIRDQTLNQRLAREGSITGALATLDLSSASDTISEGLVAHLLPPDWYSLLSMCRSGTVEYKGRAFRLEKFSSMGNGFTFPLETLIFWALVRGCCESDETVSVYGDDIICPTHRVELVMQVLTDVGFSVNMLKSFWTGSFRESCGADWISGIDVRPAFITGPVTGHDAFRLHNFYVRSGQLDFADYVREHISDEIALTGPDGYGDGHLIVSPGHKIGDWERKPHKQRLTRGFGGAIFDTWVYVKRSFDRALPGDRILPTYSIYLRDEAMDPLQESLDEDRKMRAWLIGQDPDLSPTLYESLGTRFLSNGTPVNYLPGTKGCKRISIYTFC